MRLFLVLLRTGRYALAEMFLVAVVLLVFVWAFLQVKKLVFERLKR